MTNQDRQRERVRYKFPRGVKIKEGTVIRAESWAARKWPEWGDAEYRSLDSLLADEKFLEEYGGDG